MVESDKVKKAKLAWDMAAKIFQEKRLAAADAERQFRWAQDMSLKAKAAYIKLCEEANGSVEEPEDDD